MQHDLRLRHTHHFQRLRREGRSYPRPLMVMSIAPNMLAHNRYGLITSKHIGKAVKRNRLRRRMREAVRLLHPQLKSGYDIVFVARLPLVKQPFDIVQRTISDLFQQAGLLEV
jgi:ribonuclease P protein component